MINNVEDIVVFLKKSVLILIILRCFPAGEMCKLEKQQLQINSFENHKY